MDNIIPIGHIYKITGGGLCYYGSTSKSIDERFKKHKNSYKRWLNGKYNNVTSFRIFEICDNYTIELVEELNNITKKDLLIRENNYINNNECVNMLRAYTGLTKKEYHKKYNIDNKERKKKYRDYNKAKILKK